MEYSVQRTADATYLNDVGNVVNGYDITVYFPRWDEAHVFQVPNNDPETVSAVVERWYARRQGLESLGQPE